MKFVLVIDVGQCLHSQSSILCKELGNHFVLINQLRYHLVNLFVCKCFFRRIKFIRVHLEETLKFSLKNHLFFIKILLTFSVMQKFRRVQSITYYFYDDPERWLRYVGAEIAS